MDFDFAFQRLLPDKKINAEGAETIRAEVAEEDRETLNAITCRRILIFQRSPRADLCVLCVDLFS